MCLCVRESVCVYVQCKMKLGKHTGLLKKKKKTKTTLVFFQKLSCSSRKALVILCSGAMSAICDPNSALVH